MADHFPAQVVRGSHSFRLQVVSLTSQFADINRSRSYCLHGLSRFAYIKVVSPTFISRNILWRWTDEHHCLQLADWSRIILTEILQLLAEEGNDFWFESSEGSRNGGDSTVWSAPCVLSDFFGERAVERKIVQQWYAKHRHTRRARITFLRLKTPWR